MTGRWYSILRWLRPCSRRLLRALRTGWRRIRQHRRGHPGRQKASLAQAPDFGARREAMVARTIAGRGIDDPRVLRAMRTVPRHLFVPPQHARLAYDDGPLPIAEGQTISQPFVVALMAEAAGLKPSDRVLEVGTGSGYAAAVLTALCRHVFTIERHARLAVTARETLARAGIANVTVRAGDGTLGWPEEAPFDAIIVAAGAPAAPESLKRQLAVGGRLVIPVLAGRHQDLLCIRRDGEDSFSQASRGAVRFVPLIGAEGWPDDTGPGAEIRFPPARK